MKCEEIRKILKKPQSEMTKEEAKKVTLHLRTCQLCFLYATKFEVEKDDL